MKFTGERFVPHLTETQIKVEHLQRYLSITELVKGKIVLDAACGEGYGSSILSDTASKVIGIDISDETIQHARTSYIKENLSFQTASIENLPIENHSMDVIVSFETIEHVNETLQKTFLKEIKRVLKHDGILIISTPNKHIYSDLRNYQNPFHIKEFYKEELNEFLGDYFQEIEIFHQKNEVTSVITKFIDEENIRQMKLEQDNPDLEGTYFVAICSDVHIGSLPIGSSILFADKYSEMLNRILSLQDEVEEKNAHIKYLDGNIGELSAEINRLKNILIDLQEKTIVLQGKVIDSQGRILDSNQALFDCQFEKDKLKLDLEKRLMDSDEILRRVGIEYGIENWNLDEIIERINNDRIKIGGHDQKIYNQDQEPKNKDGHINLLLESDRALENIYRSRGWKLLTNYYRLRDKLIPMSSKRRLVVKLVSKSIKEPRKMIRSLNKSNLKKLRYYMNTEDVGNIGSRIDNYMNRHDEVKQVEIKLIDSNQVKEKIVFPIYEKPLVSIIIPVYNQWDYTYSCLKSIAINTNSITYEVIIADDMSTDETTHITSYIENISVVRDGGNRGFLLNCNNATKHAKGKYIFFLNNDTNVQENWLKYLVDLVENNSKIGMVGSKLVYPDGRLQEAGGIIWNDASGWNYGRLDDPRKPEYNYVKEVDYISGAAIMIRADLWNVIGGFDERYVPAYFEDSDLAFEVRKQGYKVVLQPKSIVVHFEGISHGTDTGSGIKSYQISNKEKFIEKWKMELNSGQFDNAQNVFLARDRSRFKKTILVIDHYVPHFDKDAGSRTVFQYLKLFKSIGFNVKFLGDNFFKHEPYTSALELMGIEVLYGNWYSKHWKDWIKSNGEYIDFTFLNRPHIAEQYIDTIKRYSNSKVIYYGHDLHYLRELREYELINNSKLLDSSKEWMLKELEICRKADIVYYPSQVEVDELKNHIPNLNVKAIPAYIYDEIEKATPNFQERMDLLFVGGFAHKPNIDAVKWFLEEVFPLILQNMNDLKIYIVGSNPPDEILSYHSNNITITGFVSDDELNNYYRKSKIVVVPLRYGAGVKGKVVEALYHQVPIVTTSIGAEGLPNIESYLLTCNDPQEFAQKVLELYNNDTLLTQYSRNSYNYVQKYFSVESVLSTISLDFNIERKL
ncbi:glycosyltransferase [Paenibacillus alginolyticus]|uniref:glycosyltransferase n=1 Tax=Paenibacillus alginolyticus TaxID=59839 RepID=UPI0004097489|nr:glycosyltransferase [Paenibacillus alginolyticus]MCY9664840.1 glycosyltransferase [Paenibacillus alginolyticus]